MGGDRDGWHRLADVDEAAGSGTCSVCGPTRVRRRRGGSRSYECATKRSQQKKPGWSRAVRKPLTPEQNRAIKLRRKYGMAPAEYAALLEKQGGSCCICGRPPAQKPLCVDHDHATGKVRGLLCGPCNTAIGLFAENPDALRNAIVYLGR